MKIGEGDFDYYDLDEMGGPMKTEWRATEHGPMYLCAEIEAGSVQETITGQKVFCPTGSRMWSGVRNGLSLASDAKHVELAVKLLNSGEGVWDESIKGLPAFCYGGQRYSGLYDLKERQPGDNFYLPRLWRVDCRRIVGHEDFAGREEAERYAEMAAAMVRVWELFYGDFAPFVAK